MLQANNGDVDETIASLLFAQASEFDNGEISLETSYEEYIDPSCAIIIPSLASQEEKNDIPDDIMQAVIASEVAAEAERSEKNAKNENVDKSNEKDGSGNEEETKEERAQRLLKKADEKARGVKVTNKQRKWHAKLDKEEQKKQQKRDRIKEKVTSKPVENMVYSSPAGTIQELRI